MRNFEKKNPVTCFARYSVLLFYLTYLQSSQTRNNSKMICTANPFSDLSEQHN